MMQQSAVGNSAPTLPADFTSGMVARLFRRQMEAPPLPVRERVKHALLDWVAVAVAGASEEVSRIARQVELGECGHPVATLVGCREQTNAAGAAFVNAVSGHSQDFDSSNLWSLGHTMTPVVAAALALGEELDCSGHDLQTALLRGAEVAAVVGLATANLRKSRGLHLTGFTGVFGATASCVSLLGLSRDALVQSMGLAATQASGLRSVFGTMGKSLNAGLPARNGVMTAKLVAAGFTGPQEAITASSGYAKAYAVDFSASRPLEVMGERFGMESNVFKFHSNCHGIHSTMEALGSVVRKHHFEANMVREIVLTVPKGLLALCPFHDPTTETEAQFSVPHAAALVLAGAPTGPAGFTHEMLGNPLIRSLRRRVEVRSQPSTVPVDGPSEVSVLLSDGREFNLWSEGLYPMPDSELAVERSRLEVKFSCLVEPILGLRRASLLRAAIDDLDSLSSVRELSVLMALR